MSSNCHSSLRCHRRYTTPFSRTPDYFWFRDKASKTWSPKSDDSDHSLGSDEENVAMETDCHVDTSNCKNSQRQTFVMKTPLLSSVMVSSAHQKHLNYDTKTSLSTGSSKSLTVGRPMKALGLKDIDLAKNARAEEIRRAKTANRCSDNSNNHMSNSMSQNFLPHFPYQKTKGKFMPSCYYGDVYGNKNTVSDDNCDVVPNTLPPECSTLALPCKASKASFNKALPAVIDESRKSRVTLYSEIKDDTKCDEDLKRKENKQDIIEIIDDDDDSMVVYCSEVYNSTLEDQTICRQRHISNKPKSFRKKPCLTYFSEEESDDNVDNKAQTSNHSKTKQASPTRNKQSQVSKPKRVKIFNIFGSFIVFVTVTCLYLHFNPHGLCLESEFHFNLTGLEEDLRQEFYGQHLAMKVLLASLKSYAQGKRSKPLVLSLHGWTGTGKNYVSGIIAKHLFKHGHQSRFIHKFIIPLHFPHVSDVNLYRKQLRKWIIGNVTKCNKGGLFVFDEMDKIPSGVVSILKPFLDTKGSKSALDLNKFVFLFLSNSGGQLINQHVLEHYKQGRARENINLVNLEGLLHKYAEMLPIAWYNELLKFEVIDYFVPFLPLERLHVKQCVRRDMRTKGYMILEKMVNEVTDEMSFFPQDLQIFSSSGCKKVSSRVDVAMG